MTAFRTLSPPTHFGVRHYHRQPIATSFCRLTFGKTDAEGKYFLTYKPETPGCKVGKNRVIIGNSEGDGEDEEIEGDELVQTPGAKRLVIPARYNEKSELEEQVESGENTFNFDLKSKP